MRLVSKRKLLGALTGAQHLFEMYEGFLKEEGLENEFYAYLGKRMITDDRKEV